MANGGKFEHEDEQHEADAKERAAFELDERMADDEQAMREYRERVAPQPRAYTSPGAFFNAEPPEETYAPPSARQVAGDHYKKLAIQPSEYNHRNRLGWCEGNAVKYITRHHNKGGRRDIEKAIHYLELLIEWEYDNTTKENQND